MNKEVKNNFWNEIDRRLKRLCGRPSPTKRLIIVLVVCVVLAAVNIYFVVSTIYAIGKNSAKKEFLNIQHIEGLKIQRNDSINFLKQIKYE